MAADEDVGGWSAVAGITAKQLADIKKQSKLRQGLGALLLAIAAVLTLVFNPTVAIVFAVLAIAAIWLLPTARRKVLGEHVVLRDSAGRIRLFAALGDDGQPMLALVDKAGQPRSILAIAQQQESPVLAMRDSDGSAPLTVACVGSLPTIDLNGAASHMHLEPRVITVEGRGDDADSLTTIIPSAVMAQAGHRSVELAASESSWVKCSDGQAEATLWAARPTEESPAAGLTLEMARSQLIVAAGAEGAISFERTPDGVQTAWPRSSPSGTQAPSPQG
jgi:hypothetical protein